MASPRILTFSGWTQPADALLSLYPQAEYVDYAHHRSLDAIAGELTGAPYDLVIGWSLGGIIARQLLQSGALRAKGLVSIAAPYQFVRDKHVAEAMPADTFEQFYANYRDDTARTVKRFHGLLIKGDARHKEIARYLQHHPQVEKVEAWLPWMDFLRDYSAHHHTYDALPPTLILHGSEDAIVPAAQSALLAQKIPATHAILEGSGHAPHWHDASWMRAQIDRFWAQLS